MTGFVGRICGLLRVSSFWTANICLYKEINDVNLYAISGWAFE